ncbi:MAG: SPOR domain-containing protein [Treponema sp.]|jgi:cell division septation protein DedD|nr:SPOR domain-containing protein [Treponema sp.]
MKKVLFFSLNFLILAMISFADSEFDDMFFDDMFSDDVFSDNQAVFSQPEIAVEPAEAPPQIHAELPEVEQTPAEQRLSEAAGEATLEENQAKPPPETPRLREPPQPPVRTVVPAMTNAPPAVPSPSASARPQPPVPLAPQTGAACIYRIQLGAFSRLDNAQNCYSRLQSAGFSPLYEQYGSLWRVIIIGVKTADMGLVIMRLQMAGFTDVWVREEK